MNRQKRTAASLAVLSLIAVVPVLPAAAQKPPVQTATMKFSRAAQTWAQILVDREALGKTLTHGKLSEAHDLAFALRDSVVTLPYKSTDLSAANQKRLGAQVQKVAAIATDIDRYADAGNAAKTRAEYARLVKALTAIEALYPANTLPTSGARVLSSKERTLFLTPGGRYTAADIKANGSTSVYQKYPGYLAAHSAQVRPGDPVCPISETRPDPKLTWIVGGRTYQFCCPPCVAEFVGKAKAEPKSLQAPEAYVKK
ncbi:MAG: hypothetical protein H7Z41_12875 [Cytophagales bacterium]|nr:hypothetical protein [Armatimonadota bacterium]